MIFNLCCTTFNNGTLSTTNNGAKIVLWGTAIIPTSVEWFGLGMYNSEIYYNLGVSFKHSFQVAGTEYVPINSTGISNSHVSCTNIMYKSIQANSTQPPPNTII